MFCVNNCALHTVQPVGLHTCRDLIYIPWHVHFQHLNEVFFGLFLGAKRLVCWDRQVPLLCFSF